MNSTGTSVNVHSQMCFDIKFSAYYRQDTSINGDEGDVNRKEFDKAKLQEMLYLVCYGATDQIPTGMPKGDEF